MILNHSDNAVETEAVVAVVAGNPMTELPHGLFIPPDALEIFLDSFSGPLDLLLYLIRRQHIDIMDIPIVLITEQYMKYIELMQAHRLTLAADYLVMAAILAEIKSKLLLPSHSVLEAGEEDPRQELVRRLQAYQQYKQAAEQIDELPRRDRDIFAVTMVRNESLVCANISLVLIEVDDLRLAMMRLKQRQGQLIHYTISTESLSVNDKMAAILHRLMHLKELEFSELLLSEERYAGLVTTFLAVLELAKQSLITLLQSSLYAPLYLQAISNE